MKIFKQKKLSKQIILLSSAFSLFIFFIIPFKITQLINYSEIFPAIELMIIFQFVLSKSAKNWQLFLIGLLLDQLYQIPLGTSSISLIITNIIFSQFREKSSQNNYILDILNFSLFFSLVMIIRLLILSLKSADQLELISISFYYLTSIFSYPLLMSLLQNLANNLINYDLK